MVELGKRGIPNDNGAQLIKNFGSSMRKKGFVSLCADMFPFLGR